MEAEEEKKPFDAEVAGNDEETQPDPDEHMMMDQATGRVWIVKVRWPLLPTSQQN
jgi:transcription initiation factor TFIIF subunit beta